MSLLATYLTDLSPGSGRRTPPRSRLRTDAPELSLDGEWDFRWSAAGEPDGEWDTLPVPAHWVLHGLRDGTRPTAVRSTPTCSSRSRSTLRTSPTRTRSATTGGPSTARTGTRRRCCCASTASSRCTGWRSTATEVGVGKGSRLVQEFDVTDLLVPGPNELPVRVHQWSSTSYVEDQDQWWLPGIFRSVTLLARPRDGLDDVWLRTGYADGRGGVDPAIAGDAFPVTVAIPELGVERRFDTAADAGGRRRRRRSNRGRAESPRLYAATVSRPGETVSLRLGFRTVAIDGDRFLVNGDRWSSAA